MIMARRPFPYQLLFEQDGYTVELCIEASSLRTAYQIRYHAYRHAERIPASSEAHVRDAFDDQAHAQTYLIWHRETAIASMRVCIWSPRYRWLPLESISLFQSEIQNQIGLYQIIVESQHQVIRPEIVKQMAMKVQMLMIRILLIIAKSESSQHILSWVPHSEGAFNEHMLDFKPISKPEYLFGWKEALCLMHGQRDLSEIAYQKYGGSPILRQEIDRYHRLRAL